MPLNSTGRHISRLLAAGLIAGVLVASPASAQITLTAPRVVTASPKPFARLSKSAQALRDSIVAVTTLQLGKPYRRGADSPERGFDCSGLVQYVMSQFGARLPRTSREQATVGQKIARDVSALRPGDLLTFGRGRRISHIGIYIGNGRYVHAPTPGKRVKVESLANTRSSWWKGARRVFAFDDAAITDSLLKE